MLPYPFRRILFASILICLVCLAQGAETTVISLLDLMPKCASQCIENFISTEYPRNACARGCDLDYLCTTNTTSGYTLGEGALRCSLSLCSMEVAMSFDTYSICDSVPGALPQTHPTIVATIAPTVNPTSTATRPTTIITAEPETTDTRTTTISTTTKMNSTPTAVTTFQTPVSTTDSTPDPSSTETDEPTFTSPETSPSATTSDPPAAPARGSGLNSGAVIGVSVASGLAGFFILGVIIFFCSRRIRRRNAQDREFFEIGGHMAEPLDFSFPPRRPPMGPRPTPGTQNTDAEDARLVPPAEPGYQHPAVTVTEPEAEYDYERMRAGLTDRSGIQSSSNLEFDAASSISSRTVSDLLPDKPTYELYPRPLRWSQHKKSRPSSTATYFEEENPPAQRNLPSPSLQHFVFTGSTDRSSNRPHMAGLPANPRAMKYGFGPGPNQLPTTKGPDHGKKPVYAAAKENIPPSRQAAIHRSSSSSSASPYQQSAHIDYDDNIDNYWPSTDAGFVGARVIQPQRAQQNVPQPPPHSSFHSAGAKRNSFGDYPGYDFESLDYNGDGTGLGLGPSRHTSRHSGSFRPLTPVREIRTPTGEVQKTLDNPFNTPSKSNKPARYHPPGPSSLSAPPTQPGPAQEIVSRPRIVRQDDIKRVQIRRGKPSPKEVTVPYCPDDYWHEPESSEAQAQVQHQHQPSSFGGPSSGGREQAGPWGYITPRQSGDYSNKYAPAAPGGKGNLGMPKKKPAPMERNLTPSRRGQDLILQVD
ncbi:hypothetical protein ASPCAL10639 [Aspergillus calidoustus]|uniref:Extracellular membrane protein CFEM domain-containing protein n=1 Tax=Aspergillus calidoustus TaxID=454130 RepID=A0A0U5CCN4_ASPCI|nr:hypothetical protein ASPCAL10639 [Aspergillus calidoustus]